MCVCVSVCEYSMLSLVPASHSLLLTHSFSIQVVVEKSTVPVTTADRIQKVFEACGVNERLEVRVCVCVCVRMCVKVCVYLSNSTSLSLSLSLCLSLLGTLQS